ncbi:MAG: cell division topological specificity factor MinE [Candidatus Saccharibacteria bacterium]
MGMLNFLHRRPVPSAELARKRLRIILAVERASRTPPDHLAGLRAELFAVFRKYGKDDDAFGVQQES